MVSHGFNFESGDILAGMGASWFVSYAYYEKIDKFHRNWDKVPTVQPRLSRYKKGRAFHKAWLNEVLTMNPVKLNTNKIELDAQQTKMMAKELLKNWE